MIEVQQILVSHELKSDSHFWPRSPKNSWINFWLSWIPSSMKKWLYSLCSFLSPVTRLAILIFDHAHPKYFWSAFNFWWSSINMQKISLYISSCHSSDTVNFRVPSPNWPNPFLTRLTPKIFNHLLICVKLYQHAKNQLVPSFRSWDQSILESRDQIGHTSFSPRPIINFSINF